MYITFDNGRFVSTQNGINYQEVLDDFPNATTIRIMTYNISAKDNHDVLLERLKAARIDADIKLVTNIPSRFPRYYNSSAGKHMKNKARTNIEQYIDKLNPSSFDPTFAPYFNFTNHAKIVGTENMVYIGSANYSNESRYNIETGVIIQDTTFIKKLYDEFFENAIQSSIPYFDDDFQVLRLLVFSLLVKFNIHKEKITENLYRYNSMANKYFFICEETSFSNDDLDELVSDLNDFRNLDVRAENTYSESDDRYNERIEEIVDYYNSIDVDWLINVSSIDDTLYNYINYDSERESLQIFEDVYYAEGYDEYLDEYMEKAMDDAQEKFDELLAEVDGIAEKYLDSISSIISTLEMTRALIDEYSQSRINPDLDNT